MKKFKFRLERVLEYREKIRDEKKGELVKANLALREAEQELERLLHLEIENIVQLQGVITAAKLQLQALIAEGLRNRIHDQRGIIEIRRQDVEKAMEAYKEASKELKAVTVLRERKLQEFKDKVAHMEETFLDELSIQRAARTLN